MSKTNKILLAVLGVIVLFFVLSFTQNKSSQKTSTFSAQEKEEAAVTVKVTPKQLTIGEKPVFEIAFDTHSVDLAFDVAQISSVVDEKGNILNDSVWNGAPAGGHHREGTLTFNNTLPQTEYVELVIKNIVGVSERTFRWEL